MALATSRTDVDSEVLKKLECSICLDICEIPVYNCKNGHLVCQSHQRQLTMCPLCRVPYSQGIFRNLLAESLILKNKAEEKKESSKRQNTLMTILEEEDSEEGADGESSELQNNSCRHEGCAFSCIDPNLRDTHELNCKLRPICCPSEYCDSEIQSFELIRHLKMHGVDSSASRPAVKEFEIIGDKLIRGGIRKLFILDSIFEQQFLVTAHQVNDHVYIWVALHGDLEAVDGFRAVMKLLPTGENSINYVWNGVLSATTQNTTVEDLLSFLDSPDAMDSRRFFRIPQSEIRRNLIEGRFWRLLIAIEINSNASRIPRDRERDEPRSSTYSSAVVNIRRDSRATDDGRQTSSSLSDIEKVSQLVSNLRIDDVDLQSELSNVISNFINRWLNRSIRN